jgi:hypothetical protein
MEIIIVASREAIVIPTILDSVHTILESFLIVPRLISKFSIVKVILLILIIVLLVIVINVTMMVH